ATIHDFCASFEQAIVDVLVAKTIFAAKTHTPASIILSGGVSANNKLRDTLEQHVARELPRTTCFVPNPKYSMDNAAMIAVAGYYKARQGAYTNWQSIEANPNWKLYPII
ncbi:MAG: tRNA (adenosine(37)-N6)-threonylcarbamoyltransferase complex transferase subunit TsaD, partial [Candidatus Pacebacteria bacterium CG10_big_fil_rev_8_21_14_0_10_45_6]